MSAAILMRGGPKDGRIQLTSELPEVDKVLIFDLHRVGRGGSASMYTVTDERAQTKKGEAYVAIYTPDTEAVEIVDDTSE